MTIIETSIISKTETFETPKTDNESNIKYISKTNPTDWKNFLDGYIHEISSIISKGVTQIQKSGLN